MGWLRDRLSYGNVVATVALFIALGGAAYAIEANSVKSKHIAKNAAKGKDVKESSLRGIGAGILGGEVLINNTGTGGVTFMPVGSTTAGLGGSTLLAPHDLVATRLRVRFTQPMVAGSRTIGLTRNFNDTPLACTIEAPRQTCRSNAKVTYREGDVIGGQENHAGTTQAHAATIGWQALTR